MATMKYVTDFRVDPTDDGLYVPAIQAVLPHVAIQAAEVNSAANPTIPLGRVRCTIANVDMLLHGEIMQIPGVELFSGDIA
jgi:hypothetical protein